MGLRVERQLDLSSVAARLRGSPVSFVRRQLDLSSVAARLRGSPVSFVRLAGSLRSCVVYT
ncbi:hypothetical protein Taro_033279 [Colocasia esculenta]|uniref:Uncharacterized protein n=1 Tax=Colocasia esculenta TaxID=4460 RepID=A0A843VTG7_COLES|nr:hypothetical protein [Colocasia esculenta]